MLRSANPFVRHDTRPLKTTTHHGQITDIEKAATGAGDLLCAGAMGGVGTLRQ
jgi:hypothetical protein